MTRALQHVAGVQVMRWGVFVRDHFRWHQGEHVTLVGPTGQGKTTLTKSILPLRRHVAVIATKPDDDTMTALIRGGYRKVTDWGKVRSTDERVVLWPTVRKRADKANLARQVQYALDCIYVQGGWCVDLDETRYIAEKLGCREALEDLWLQGRALNVSLVASTQRPRHLPLEAFSQATHLFLWRSRDQYDVDRLGGLGTHNTRQVRDLIASLPPFTVLYINTRTEQLVITRAPR